MTTNRIRECIIKVTGLLLLFARLNLKSCSAFGQDQRVGCSLASLHMDHFSFQIIS